MKKTLIKELELLKKYFKNLEKKDDYLLVSDFDSTIFSRKEQLEKSKILRENRWDLGNKIILEKIWLENFINEFYKWKDFPKLMVSKLREKKDLILTAWVKEIQEAKIKATSLENINLKIVKKAQDKPLELIKYIIFELKFIPNKIIIYEDKVNYFLETKNILENFLNTKLEIIFVEMDWNNKNPKTKKLA